MNVSTYNNTYGPAKRSTELHVVLVQTPEDEGRWEADRETDQQRPDERFGRERRSLNEYPQDTEQDSGDRPGAGHAPSPPLRPTTST